MEPAAVSSDRTARVLVAEDDVTLLSLVADKLRLEGYEVHSAATGDAALDLLETEYFDVIVLDLVLPRPDGLEVIASLRRANVDTPIVAISGAVSFLTNLEAARVLGATHTMAKPIRMKNLVAIVNECVNAKRAEPGADLVDQVRAHRDRMRVAIKTLKGLR